MGSVLFQERLTTEPDPFADHTMDPARVGPSVIPRPPFTLSKSISLESLLTITGKGSSIKHLALRAKMLIK